MLGSIVSHLLILPFLVDNVVESVNHWRGNKNKIQVAPLWVSLLILGISGIPIMEKKYDTKFVGSHPLAKAYAEYKASTSILVPLPKDVFR